MSVAFNVPLTGAYWKGSASFREAQLRPLNGSDEAFLFEAGESISPAARATALLARCMVRLGDEQVSPGLVRSLTVGDREALLLHLWRITFGERLPCVFVCPLDQCGEKMDLELKVADILLPAYAGPRPRYEIALDCRDARYLVRFRLPTGADQEIAAERALTSASEAERQLLIACVEQVSRVDSGPLDANHWPEEIADSLDREMAALDPQAVIVMQIQCPSCGGAFLAEFDAEAFLYQEVKARLPHLYREIHQIASSYHWSEAEILAMSPKKRGVYLRMLAGEEALG